MAKLRGKTALSNGGFEQQTTAKAASAVMRFTEGKGDMKINGRGGSKEAISQNKKRRNDESASGSQWKARESPKGPFIRTGGTPPKHLTRRSGR